MKHELAATVLRSRVMCVSILRSGLVRLDILDEWNPSRSLRQVLELLRAQMSEPTADNMASGAAASLYASDRFGGLSYAQ